MNKSEVDTDIHGQTTNKNKKQHNNNYKLIVTLFGRTTNIGTATFN
jgi:hypothetical protein